MTRKWLDKTSKEILSEIDALPVSFEGFKKELLERPDKINDLEVIKLIELYYSEHFAVAIFEVKSKNGQIYTQEYISRRGGQFHSLRGIVLIKQNGKLTHFVVRKTERFGIAKEIYESIGNIYQPISEYQKDKILLSTYIEDELAKCLHLPAIKVEQFYDLGNVLTDTSMFNNIIRIFAVTIEVNKLSDISVYFEGKSFNDKGYNYQIEIIPIEKFYEFFGEVADSFLLAIFGRLQALNVVKL